MSFATPEPETTMLFERIVSACNQFTDTNFRLDVLSSFLRVVVQRDNGTYHVSIMFPSPRFPFWQSNRYQTYFEPITVEDLREVLAMRYVRDYLDRG